MSSDHTFNLIHIFLNHFGTAQYFRWPLFCNISCNKNYFLINVIFLSPLKSITNDSKYWKKA